MKISVFNIRFSLLFHIVLAAFLFSCVSPKNVWMFQDGSGNAQTSFKRSAKPTYVLKSGDHLYIRVNSVDAKTSKFFQTDFPSLMNSTYLYLNNYIVDEQGYLHYSFFDKILVKGLTIDDARKKVQEAVDAYFKEASITLKLVDFQVSILGEVGAPGTFTIDKDQVDIYHAFGLVGGVKPFGNLRKITLVRQTVDGSEVHILDLSDKSMLTSEFYYLMPNDVIYVPERKAKAFVFSETMPYTALLSGVAIVLSIVSLKK